MDTEIYSERNEHGRNRFGIAYSTIYYLDEDLLPTTKDKATMCSLYIYNEKGELIRHIFGGVNSQNED